MELEKEGPQSDPMASETVGRLLAKYSLPAIASSLVNSLYNIVDQIFVGHSIGELDNAATNVAFPLVMIVTTLAMVFGVGGAYRGRGVRGGVAAPGSEGNATVDCLTVLEKIPSLFARRNFFFLIFRKQFISIQTTKGEYDMPVSRKQGL